MSCYIGIDIGGTYLKAARLWPKNNEIADVSSVPTPETLEGIESELYSTLRFLGNGAQGILITGQVGSYAANGKFYSWKSDKPYAEIVREIYAPPWPLLNWAALTLCSSARAYLTHDTVAESDDILTKDIVSIGSFGEVPIYIPVGDHQCSLLGAGLQNHELSVNLGTGGQISILGGTDRPYFDGRGLTCHVRLPAGRALSSLQKLLNRSWLELESEAEKITCEQIRCHLALYPGPCGSFGWFRNLTEAEMTPGHFYRSALESIARNVENCTIGMPRFDAVRLSGGMFARSELLRTLVAARFPGKRIEWNKERAGREALYGLMELAKGLA